MPEPVNRATSHTSNSAALENMHKLLLEALRHREQEIFRYLAILGPAFGGFVWLLHAGSVVEKRVERGVETVTTHQIDPVVFVVSAIGVLLLLLLGAVYSLALGYNYRCITLQVAKLESMLCIKDYMLKGWPKCPKEFKRRHTFCGTAIPWCTPPAVIKVFWRAFLVSILGVISAVCYYQYRRQGISLVIPVVGFVAFFVNLGAAWWFGRKLHKLCKKEADTWACKCGDGGSIDSNVGAI